MSTPVTPPPPSSSSGRPRAAAARPRRSPRVRLALLLALVVVPIVELVVVIQVGQAIGAGWTILLLLATSLLGGWVVRREGARAFRALRTALDEGRMPTSELADGALVLLGGAMLVSPGFVTDALGALLVLPLTRPLFRRLLGLLLARRVAVVSAAARAAAARGDFPHPGAAGAAPPFRRRPSGPVVPGEVVDEGESFRGGNGDGSGHDSGGRPPEGSDRP